MSDYTDIGIFFIVGSIVMIALIVWIRYTDTHPNKK